MIDNQIIQLDLRSLRIMESLASYSSLDELLEHFLSEFVQFDHVRKAEVYLFGKKKRLIPVAEAVAVVTGAGRKVQTKSESWLLEAPVRHSSRKRELPQVRPIFSIPMLDSEELLGFLNIYLDRIPATPEYRVGSFYLLATTLAAKIREIRLRMEMEELKEELQRLTVHNRDALTQVTLLSKELYAISAISAKVNQTISLPKSLYKSASKIRELLGAYGVLIYLKKGPRTKPRLVVSEFETDSILKNWEKTFLNCVGNGFLTQMQGSERPFIRVLDAPLRLKVSPSGPNEAVKMLVGVPFVVKKRNIGALIILHNSDEPFRSETMRLLSGLTNIMGMAIENMNLYNQRVQRENEAAFLFRSIAKFNETLDLGSTLRAIAQKGAEYVGENCEVYLLTETKVPMVRVIGKKNKGHSRFISQSFRKIDSETFLQLYRFFMEQSNAILLKSINHSRKLPEDLREYLVKSGMRSLICVPLEIGSHRVGILLACQKKQGKTFNSHDLSVIKAFGRAAAVAVQNARSFLDSVELSDFLEGKIREKTTKLKQIEKRQMHRVENRNDIIFRINKRNRFVFVNRAMERLSGYSRDAFYRGVVLAQDVVAPEDWERVREAFVKVMTEQIPMIKDLEYRHQNSDGQTHIISLTVYPEKDTSGRIIGLEGVGRDITERVRLQRELERAKDLAMLGEFSAAIAHQIRNPISDILMGINLLKSSLQTPGHSTNGESGDPKISRILHDVTKSINNINQIVSELLDYTKTLRLSLAKHSLELVLREVVETFQDIIREKDIVIEQEYEKGLPEIELDAVLMGQAFQNVVHNAIQAVDGGGRISIAGRFFDETRDHILISVKDTGPGIPSEDMGKIFRPLYTTKSSGTGLGLSLSHRIVHAHHGTIWVENNIEGGATFYIRLPARFESEELVKEYCLGGENER